MDRIKENKGGGRGVLYGWTGLKRIMDMGGPIPTPLPPPLFSLYGCSGIKTPKGGGRGVDMGGQD